MLRDTCQNLQRQLPLTSQQIFKEFDLLHGHPWREHASSPTTTYYGCLYGVVQLEQPRKILEIGTAFGMSAAALLKACSNIELFISLDLGIFSEQLGMNGNNIEFARNQIHNWCQHNSVSMEQVRFYRANTQPPGKGDNDNIGSEIPRWYQIPELFRLLQSGDFDVIFVDGKHTEDGLLNDLTTFWPFLKPGGLIICDDLHDPAVYHGRFSWVGDTWRSFHNFIDNHSTEILDYYIWNYPQVLPPGKDGLRPFGLIRKRSSSRSGCKTSGFEMFDYKDAIEVNRARQDHLASLGLELANQSVLEVGAGVGWHTAFFEKFGCSVMSTDARPENVEEHLRRYPHRKERVEVADLSISGSHDRFGEFDIVYCYGTLYHLADPSLGIMDLAKVCKRLFLLETCVNSVDNSSINRVTEPTSVLNQSFEGIGCRPARDWIFSELRKYFPYVYITASQPNHPDFPLNWPASHTGRNTRAVFVASSYPLTLPTLRESLPSTQYRLSPVLGSTQSTEPTLENELVIQPHYTVSKKLAEFREWISAIASAQHCLYYRDQTPESLNALGELVHRFNPSKVVELGTLSGLSLRAWLSAESEAEIIAIDLSFEPLRKSQQILSFDLSKVKLLEQDILKTDFSQLWTSRGRVLLYIDAHDQANVPIMEYVLRSALPALPTGSVVVVDDLWHSLTTLSNDNALQFFENTVINEIDPLQCFEGYYAPYWKGGSFFGFLEVIPLMKWVNRHRINLVLEPGAKSVTFEWPLKSENSGDNKFDVKKFEQLTGKVNYNPVEGFAIHGDKSLPMNQQALALSEKGAQLYAAGNLKEAMYCFEQALNLTSSLSGVFYAQAICLARKGQLKAAARILQQEINHSFSHPNAQTLLTDIQTWTSKQHKSESESSQQKVPQAITIFTMPKPFRGDIGIIQRNAIKSWTLLRPQPEIILLGDEEGTEEIAKEFGLRHVSAVDRNEFGTPLVNSIFERAQALAKNKILAYVNADIILLSDFLPAVRQVADRFFSFLIVGQRWDTDLKYSIDFSKPDWEDLLRKQAITVGKLHASTGIDYFVFTPGLWKSIPPFAIGRTVWDNWLVFKPLEEQIPVIDASPVVTVVHQNHGYEHLPGGIDEAWCGAEAQRNLALAGGYKHVCTTKEATWKLITSGLIQANIFRQKLPKYINQIIEFNGLKVGQRLKVKGKLSEDGVFAAQKISPEAPADDSEIEGLIQSIDHQKNILCLLNREFVLPDNIAVKGLQGDIIGLKDLKAGDAVKLKGKFSESKGFVAAKIKMQETNGFDCEELQGNINKIDWEKKILDVIGFTVMVNQKTALF